MEELKVRIDVTLKALMSLDESLKLLDDVSLDCLHNTMRDSVIKRFEYSMDTFWKCLKEYLEKVYKISFSVVTPKSTFRSALNVKIIHEEMFDLLLEMVDDRNLTSHAYNEELAEEISNHVHLYYKLMNSIMLKLTNEKVDK